MWEIVNKGDVRCRELADRHYTRKAVGHPMFTRPGYNFVLYYEDEVGSAAFVWWRPKWEDGRPGTQRKDGLRCLECTLFRNESGALSSDLIRAAVEMVRLWDRAQDQEWPDGLITGVSSGKTAKGRSRRSRPGACFRHAGWTEMEKATTRADVWLRAPVTYGQLMEAAA